MSLPQPSPAVGVKLASIVVHAQEALGPGGSPFDLQTIDAMIGDPDVQAYLDELRPLALLPVSRS